MAKLTSKEVHNISAPGTYEDGQGLRLVVKKTGRKSWVLRFQINGNRREMGMGGYPAVSLREARIAATNARAKVLNGVDPLAERQAAKEAEKKTRDRLTTFNDAASDYISAHRAGWKSAKHAQQWENTLKTYASPVIGGVPANLITTDLVLEVLRPIWLTKPETANRVRNRIELILDSAKARGLRDGENPARWRGHLDKLLPKRSKVKAVKHHAALPWGELPEFMAIISGRAGLAFRALELTILTATRTNEVLGATWDEFNVNAGVWTIPVARMKAGKEHRVPITDSVFELIDRIPRVANSPYLFPGQKKGRPLSNMAMLMALRRIDRGDLTAHGFRSTFRDWAGECTPHARDVCEQALAHSLGDSVEAAYRRGDLFEKRRALMGDWGHFATSFTGKTAEDYPE